MHKCEQALAAEPKAKGPVTHLPKSIFMLDEFKHKCSSKAVLSVVLPYFGEHFREDGSFL